MAFQPVLCFVESLDVDDEPSVGTASLALSNTITDGVLTFRPNGAIVATLDALGTAAIVVPSNDGVEPVGTYYTYGLNTKGSTYEPYKIVVSASGLDTLLEGTGAPSSGTGANGDWYLDTVAGVVYGPKAAGAWPAVGTVVTNLNGQTPVGVLAVATLLPALPPPPYSNMATAAALAAEEVARADGDAETLTSAETFATTGDTTERNRAEAAEAALQATVAALGATAWLANTAYPAEKIVSNGVGLWEAPTGGVPSRATFTPSDWIHLADIALPVGTTAGTVAAGNDSRIVGAATAVAVTTESTARANADTTLANAISTETTRATGVEALKADLVAGQVPTGELGNVLAAIPSGTFALPIVDTGTVHSAAYSMVAQDQARFDISAGSITQSLPVAPPDKTQVYLKVVKFGTGNAVTYTCGGSDVLNVAGGATSGQLKVLWHGALLSYNHAEAIWTVQADDLALSQLDARYAPLSSFGVVADSANLGPFNLVNAGVVGSSGSTSNINSDHTSSIQAYINTVSAIAAAISGGFQAAVIDCPCLHYRVQNVVLPGNVVLRLNGTRFSYVSSAGTQTPPTGPGNYVFRGYGAYNAIAGYGSIQGNGGASANQPDVAGVWWMPPGGAGVGKPGAFSCRINDMIAFNNFGGRAVFDQGIACRSKGLLTENCLLNASVMQHFMGAYEQAGTDGELDSSEIGCSVTPGNGNVLGGIPVPRNPTIYDATSLATTTAATITLPLVNGTISTTAISGLAVMATGGFLSIGGHFIAFGGISGNNLTGCFCTDSGTIPISQSIIPLMGFTTALVLGGANNWMGPGTNGEISDVSMFIGPNVMAHTTAPAALTTSGVGTNPVSVDNACYLAVGGGTVNVWTTAGGITYSAFTYGSISNTTVATAANLSTSPISLNVGATAGWPAAGSFSWMGLKVTYTSIVDGSHIGGCTISAGSVVIPVGAYITANTLNGCFVATGTLAVGSGVALLNGTGASQAHAVSVRADLSMCHGVVLGGGSGELTSIMSLRCAVTANGIYDGFHNPTGLGSQFNINQPVADCSSVTNRYRTGISDTQGNGAVFNRWNQPRTINCILPYSTGNTGGGWFSLARGPGALLAVNSATPSVADSSDNIDANTTPTTITNFAGGVNGQEMSYLQGVNTTIANNANIVTKSGSAISPPGSGFILLRFKKIGFATTPTPAWYQY